MTFLSELQLENNVFVAFTDEELFIHCFLSRAANQTGDTLSCSDPSHRQVYSRDIAGTEESPEIRDVNLELRGLKSSGEYVCRYQTAEAFWFLHLRGELGG